MSFKPRHQETEKIDGRGRPAKDRTARDRIENHQTTRGQLDFPPSSPPLQQTHKSQRDPPPKERRSLNVSDRERGIRNDVAVCIEKGLVAGRREDSQAREESGEIEGRRPRTYDETSHRPNREQEKVVGYEGVSPDLGKERTETSENTDQLPLFFSLLAFFSLSQAQNESKRRRRDLPK